MAKKPKLRIIPLGGVGEIGKNMMVIEYGSEILLIDAGLMFPDEEMYGIDLVLPDFTYLRRNQERLKAIILTHGHEDHTGALPYLLRDVRAPIYGTKLTLGLVEGKLSEHRLHGVSLRDIKHNEPLKFNHFTIDFIGVGHSIPDGVGLAIHTPHGVIIHSGDFKLDQTPIDGRLTEFDKFAAYRGRVLALLSDSTNAETPGYTLPERTVGERLHELFRQAQGRVVVASFASHIHRIQQVIDAAHDEGRKVAVVGRNMLNNVEIAGRLGYLHVPGDTVIDISEINDYPPHKILVLSTGSQGEPLSALARMAARTHKFIQIEPGDTVIISANPVPGNEKSVHRIIDLMLKHGAKVFYRAISHVHVSGHAAQEELKIMLNLVKPRYFVPIHGEFRHLHAHADLAEKVGIPPENIFVAENGSVIELTANSARMVDKVPAGLVFVDGLGVGDIGNVVMRDRQVLSQDGICIAVVTINTQNGRVVAGPDLISRGFIYVKEATDLMEEAKERIKATLEQTAQKEITDYSILRNQVKDTLSRFLYERTKRRPMIMPIIVEL